MDTDWKWIRNGSQTFGSLKNLLASLEFAREIGTRTVGNSKWNVKKLCLCGHYKGMEERNVKVTVEIQKVDLTEW